MKLRLIHLGLAIAALLAAPIAAQAADLGPGPSYKAPAYVAPSYGSWSGFYVGLNGGYGSGTADTGIGTVDPKGYLIGGTVGYNLQTGIWVWGLEGDLAYTTMKDDCGAGCELKMPFFATARGRIGYAGWGSFMPYITGGAAFAQLKLDTPGGDTATHIGWTAGAGVEYALFSNWSVKLEYLYADLGTFDLGGGDVDYKSHFIRAGLNYRF